MRGKGHYIGLPKAWGRIRKQVGLEDVRIHDLRHSFASVGARAGMGLQVIGKPHGIGRRADSDASSSCHSNEWRPSCFLILSQIADCARLTPLPTGGIGKSTLDKLRLTGGGPAYNKLNSIVVYDMADLDAWVTANKYNSTSEYRPKSG